MVEGKRGLLHARDNQQVVDHRVEPPAGELRFCERLPDFRTVAPSLISGESEIRRDRRKWILEVVHDEGSQLRLFELQMLELGVSRFRFFVESPKRVARLLQLQQSRDAGPKIAGVGRLLDEIVGAGFETA